MTDLDPAVVGSCSFAALINRAASVVWRCLARFDGNPLFHGLLGAPKNQEENGGFFAIDLKDRMRSEQAYSGSTEL
jgi:hypothetical protein